MEEWEEDLLKNKFLEKYKDIVFYDPDNKCIYTVWHKNLECQRGRNGGWCLIGCPLDDKLEDESFPVGQMLIDLIAGTDQNSNVDIILDVKVVTV